MANDGCWIRLIVAVIFFTWSIARFVQKATMQMKNRTVSFHSNPNVWLNDGLWIFVPENHVPTVFVGPTVVFQPPRWILVLRSTSVAELP